jgi:hypothetical protein
MVMTITMDQIKTIYFDNPANYTQTGRFFIGESPTKNPGDETFGLFIIAGINLETGLRTPFGVAYMTNVWTEKNVLHWLNRHWSALKCVTGQQTVKP